MSNMLGQLLDGRYKVIEILGSGGFGQTFVAEDKKMFDSQCVVKVLKPISRDPQTIELARRLFAAEARLLHELGNHDQIPRLFASFEEDQDFYLVQEYIQGYPLSQELTPNVKISESEVIRLVKDILEPLAYVHQKNVIHRDIKPPNLMRRSTDGKIVLIDFGSVKQVQNQVVEPDGQTRMTVAIGTYGYMPTEQGAGEPELSSDIYAVGMIALQALTGIMPTKLPKSATREICWRDQVSTTTEFAEFLDKMIRYDCRQRYQSAVEALENLAYIQASSLEVAISQPFEYSNTSIDSNSNNSVNEEVIYTPTGYSQTAISEDPVNDISNSLNQENDELLQGYTEIAPEVTSATQSVNEQDRLASNNAYENGMFKLRRRDITGALSEFDRAIKADRSNIKAYQERAAIWKMLGEYDNADKDLQVIRNLNQERKNIVKEKFNESSNIQPIQAQVPTTPNNNILQNVRNTLTRPIEGPRTLGVTVFGPRGVGKTSLLAAMYDQFGKTTQGTSLQLTAELVTSAILQDYVAKLKSPFDTDAELEVMPGIQGTAEPQDFVFDLGRTGGPTAIKLHFKDFPGGRIGTNARAEEIAEVKSLLEICSVVLVVIDAPALMEENGKWHDLVNKPMLITDYFKTAYQNVQSPRLVLLVPSKCEKYIQSAPEDLLAKVKERYSTLLNFFQDPTLSPHVVVAVTPIQTLGNMKLTHIDTQSVNGQLQPRFYYKKTANVYAPKDSEQPLRYLLKFLLKIHLQKRTFLSKAIRSVMGRLFEDGAFKSTVQDFTRQCKTSGGFAVLQDIGKWLD